MRNNIVNKGINYVFVLFAFLLPLSTPMTNATVALLIVLWLIEGKWSEKYKVLKSAVPFLFFAAFIILLGLSIFWSKSIDGGFFNNAKNAITFYFSYYVFGFMIIPIMLTSVQVVFTRYIISAFLGAMLVSELMSWSIFMGWVHYKHVLPNDPSPFMHHTFYSIFLAVTIFVLATQFSQAKTVLYKALIALFMLSAVVNLFLNGGRLGQLAFFVAFFVFVGLKYRITFKSVVMSVGLVMVVFLFAYKVSPIFQKRMDLSSQSLVKISNGKYNSSWGVRANILIVSKEIVKEHPILGMGIGNTRTEFLIKAKEFQQTGFFPKLNHLHNGYMQILVETGLLGLLLFLLFIYTLLKLKLQREQAILMFTIVVIYMVGFVGEPLLFSRKPFFLFNLFVAIFIYHRVLEKD